MGVSQRLLQAKGKSRSTGQGGQFGKIAFKIEGMEGVIREIRKLPDRVKRLEILKILRRQVKPIRSAIKVEADKTNPEGRIYKIRGGKTVEPGNLGNSIKIFNGRNKEFPSVFVGPEMGPRKRNDAFYAFFIQYGTIHIAPNDFIDKATKPLLPGLAKEMSNSLEKYVQRKIKTLNL